MSYLQELGEISSDAWCSTATPPKVGCSPVAGVCLPMDPQTLSIFQQVQHNLNRLLAARGMGLIDVDGRIGPATVRALGVVAGIDTSQGGCDAIASSISDVLFNLAAQVIAESAPDVPDPAPKSPPTIASGGRVLNPPADVVKASVADQEDFMALLSSPLGIAAVIVGGILLWRVAAPAMRTNPGRRRRARARRAA